jgi:hypothetical protein
VLLCILKVYYRVHKSTALDPTLSQFNSIHAFILFLLRHFNTILPSTSKSEGKGPFQRPKIIWDDNIKMDLKEIGCEGVVIQLGRDRVPVVHSAASHYIESSKQKRSVKQR